MDKTTDYIAWLGDIDFTVRPLGEVDAIVLCTLAYYDFGPVIPEIAGKRGGFFLKDILPCMESGKIEIRMQEMPGVDMLRDTLKNFSIEGTGWESAIISRILKGGTKEAIWHAVNNTVQPVIIGRLENPELELPEETEELLDNGAESETISESEAHSEQEPETDLDQDFNYLDD